MADNTRVNELQEKLLQAMDILNAKALDSVSYDKTILCTIENDENKKDGKYEVSDGSIIFTAYSTDERYRNGDVVYVTIPQGNYENQKMIVGKKTSETEKPFNFVTPFDSFFSMTGNLAATASSAGLVANDIMDDSKPMEECMTYTTLLNKAINDQDLINYTRLGIKADFKSWIKNAVRGNYGLEIILSTEKQGTVEGAAEKGTYTYTLDSSNMYGNPYSFETFYNQELVLDIGDKDIGKVTNIKVNFYQAANFYDQFNEPIPSSLNDFKTETDTNRYVYYPADNDEQGETVENSGYYIPLGDKLNDNLFVQNLEIHFGYDISTFTNDYVEIYTADRDSYRRSTQIGETNELANQKNINMRWVHMKDGTPVDMVAAAGKLTGDDQLNYEVRWYRYRVGAAAADEYCGIYWERIKTPLELEWQERLTEVLEDSTLTEEERNNKTKEINKVYSILISKENFNYTLNPDVNKQQEKIKAIIIYEGNAPYRSNELIFNNEEQLPPSKEAQHIASALNIVCNDGTKGNYFLYGQGRRIKDQSYANMDRILSCYFDIDNDGEHESLIQDIEGEQENKPSITWIFPNKNTMIELVGKTEEEKNQDTIVRNIAQPKYRIPMEYNSYYTNNTIQCIYELNGVVYTTEIDLAFGKTGTMGSDQTLVIDFVGDTIAYSNEDTISFQTQLFDTSGKPQEIPSGAVKWEWYCNDELTSNQNKIINDSGNAILTLNFNENNKWKIDKLHILQATIGTLTTYFSIPIKNGDYSYIDGPTEVIYRSDGKPDYSDLPYKLYDSGGTEVTGDNVKWNILASNDAWGYKYVGKLTSTEFSNPDKIYCTRIENYKNEDDGTKTFIDYTYTEQTQYDSTAIYYEKIIDNFIGTINDYTKLEPVSIYIKDAPVYGVVVKVDNTIVWSQPIFVCQNQYPSTVINQWDGKSLVLDEQNSAVIAAAVSAGRKNSDNTFSGVMMGDWSDSDLDTDEEISRQTGLYGFHHGAMSYAFKEDGTAFIGKSSMARINFDGNESTIYSAGYKDTVANPGGMMINLFNNGNPYISLKSPGTMDSNTYSEMKLDTKSGGSTIYMKKGSGEDIKITNSGDIPLKIGSNFDVAWNGNIRAAGGSIGNWNILASGALQSNDGKITLNTQADGSVQIGTGSNSKIVIDAGATINNKDSDSGIINIGSNAQLGYVKAETTGWGDKAGVGLIYTSNSGKAVVQTTGSNAALKYNTQYITVENNNISIGTTSNNQQQIQINGATTYNNQDGNTILKVTHIKPENQFGIYARFA